MDDTHKQMRNNAKKALQDICGAKTLGWISGIKTEEDLRKVRREILNDYSYNSFSLGGIEKLALVLRYFAFLETELI